MSATYSSNAQTGERATSFALKSGASLVWHKNTAHSDFAYAPSGAAGLHLAFLQNYGRWQFETGLGAERISFKQKSGNFRHSAVPEDVRLTFHYFALQMPVTVHYNLSYNFGIYLGSNFIAANLSSYKLGVSTGVLGSSAMEIVNQDEFPGFQFNAELHTGFTYGVLQNISLGFRTTYSLNTLSGMNLRFSSDQAISTVERVEYRWIRFGAEIIYHFR